MTSFIVPCDDIAHKCYHFCHFIVCNQVVTWSIMLLVQLRTATKFFQAFFVRVTQPFLARLGSQIETPRQLGISPVLLDAATRRPTRNGWHIVRLQLKIYPLVLADTQIEYLDYGHTIGGRIERGPTATVNVLV